MKDRRVPAFLIILVVLALSLVFASVVLAGPETKATLTAELTGAREVPGPGDPDGTGWASIRLNVHEQTVCWELSVQDIAPATAAHIHVGRSSVAGPVVVALSPPTDGWSEGCAMDVDKALIRDIIRHPSKYYVNVHNADYPAGAVRDQLN